MGKIMLTMQMSLDGVVSDVEQWADVSDEIVQDSLDYCQTLDAIVIGGNTYPFLAEYWQDAEESSGSEIERTFAKKINDLEKIVLSRSDVELTWRNSRQLLITDTASFINEFEKLKNEEGKNISVESGVGAWQAFLRHALFDEIWVWVHPVIIGQGTKLFAEVISKFSMQLNSSKTYKNGAVGLYYQKI